MYDGLSFHLFLHRAPLFMSLELQNDNYNDEVLEIRFGYNIEKSNRHQFDEIISVAVKTARKHI